jgi:hypothetical protein
MGDAKVPQSVLFPDLFRKPVVMQFDQPHASFRGLVLIQPITHAQFRNNTNRIE